MSVTRVLLTGMSGTGKSSVLRALGERGWRTVDADEDGLVDEHPDRTDLRVPELVAILQQPRTDRPLAVAVTGEGQGRLYPLVDHVVLLTAPWSDLQARLAHRATNDFGKDPAELARIRADLEQVEPLLRQGAGVVIDTSTMPLADVVDRVDALAGDRAGAGGGR